ncbi:MAG: recombinase family protein [Candidatus Velthaea sp.]
MDTRQLAAAIYVRVSTHDQKTDMQLTELRAYAERMGWVVKEYGEKMSSVKKRPVLEQLMADARQRKFDVVLVWKLDRFARSLQQLLTNLQLLDSFGVRFICVTQGIDTDKNNPASKLMMHIIGAVAEFERGIIVERVRAGVAEAQRQGKHCGRPATIWRRDTAADLRKAGMSLRKISAVLGVPRSTIAEELKGVRKASR